MIIEATIDVQIEQISGPEITDPKHVIAWTCADGAWFEGRNGFRFEVCPTHSDPDECQCAGTVSIFRALVTSADLSE